KSVGQRLKAAAERVRGKKGDGGEKTPTPRPPRGNRKVTTPRKAGGSLWRIVDCGSKRLRMGRRDREVIAPFVFLGRRAGISPRRRGGQQVTFSWAGGTRSLAAGRGRLAAPARWGR